MEYLRFFIDSSGSLNAVSGVIIGSIITLVGQFISGSIENKRHLLRLNHESSLEVYRVRTCRLENLSLAAAKFYALCQAGPEECAALDAEANEAYFRLISLMNPEDPEFDEAVQLLSELRLTWDNDHGAIYSQDFETMISRIIKRENEGLAGTSREKIR